MPYDSRCTQIFLVMALFVGCRGHDDAAMDHEHEGVSVTLWTEKTELFMEHPALIVGQEAAFAVHLTDLKDFKPVTEGKLTCVFKKDGSEQVTVVVKTPSYPGIFRPVVQFRQAGVYNLQLELHGQQVSDVIHVPDVRVYADEASVPHEKDENPGEDLITFLKEQQWNIDFRTEPARKRRLSASVHAVGEIFPKPQWHAEVPTPVAGVVLAEQNINLPSVGTWVKKGDMLAVISPSANDEASLNAIRSEYLHAKAEYERSKRLFEKQAISRKRLHEARLRFEAKKASYGVIARQIELSHTENEGNGTTMFSGTFHLKAPITGVIEEIHFHLGQTVETGQKLFVITNPKRILLKAYVAVARLARIKKAHDASFRVEGYDQEFNVSELNGRLLAIGSTVDAKSRTVPVIFEFDNPENILKVGMFAQVSIRADETIETLAIPNSAIFDDNGTPVAYVHVEGESFAKRVLTTGITDRGYTQILSGITQGERVVTVGGYQVRLASLSTSVPEGHGHEH